MSKEKHTHSHSALTTMSWGSTSIHTHIYWLWLWLCWVVSGGKHRTYTAQYIHAHTQTHSLAFVHRHIAVSQWLPYAYRASSNRGRQAIEEEVHWRKKVVENCVCFDLLLETTVLKRTLCRSHRMCTEFTECVTESKRREAKEKNKESPHDRDCFVFIYLYTI